MRVGIKVQDFDLWVSGFGFRGSGCEFRGSGSGFRKGLWTMTARGLKRLPGYSDYVFWNNQFYQFPQSYGRNIQIPSISYPGLQYDDQTGGETEGRNGRESDSQFSIQPRH